MPSHPQPPAPGSDRQPPRRGQLFVIAAPSGAGKTSLVRALMKHEPQLKFSISWTTRPQRPNETHGNDYFFVSREDFQRRAHDGEFLEHASVFDNLYGTARTQVEQALASGQDLLLEIDWQGARQIRSALPESITIFILPPSRAALEERLKNRGTDSAEVIARRLKDAVADMSHWREFDYVIRNDDFERALAELRSIVAGRGDALRADRPGLETQVARLLA